jgi:hypothetical protein
VNADPNRPIQHRAAHHSVVASPAVSPGGGSPQEENSVVLTSDADQTTDPDPTDGPAGRAALPWGNRVLRSGWLPFTFAVVVTIGWLSFYSVPLTALASYGGYLVLGIVLPGMLLWRLAHRGPSYLYLDLAAGTALGYAVEIGVYIPARALGFPLLPQIVQAAILLTFVAVPGLRRYFRSGTAERPPVLWSWCLVLFWLLVLLWSVRYVSAHGMTWPSYGAPDSDMNFHLALIGEAKHHMPMTIPWVSGEPVLYHWFVYPEMASTSWATGIEPSLLLTRLSPLPMLAGFLLLIPALTRRLTANWWSGIVAIGIALFAVAPLPYGWPLSPAFTSFGFSAYEDGSLLKLVLWTSPTQTFATLLFVPVVLVLIDLLDGRGADRRLWALFVVGSAAVMGAKATYLPLLMAGLLLVVVVQFLLTRRLPVVPLVASAFTFGFLLFAQFVLFGGFGSAQGMSVDPLRVMVMSAAPATTNLLAQPHLSRLLLATAITMFCWLCMWGGVVGLGRRFRDPQIVLLLGIGLSGLAAVLTLSQVGGSQGYFTQSARPYLAVAAACGLSVLVPKLERRIAVALLGAVAAGVVLTRVIRVFNGPSVPHLGQFRPVSLGLRMLLPYALIGVILVATGAAVWWRGRRVGLSLAMVVALAVGFSLYGAYLNLRTNVHNGRSVGWRELTTYEPIMVKGTPEAGRWLRDHSRPDDLVATNAHCAHPVVPQCYNSHFAVAAYTERRVLVNGWSFTPTAHKEAARRHVPVYSMPYWKPGLLAENDAAFTDPSPATIGTLRDKYHVRWMFVDEKQGNPSPRLGDFATLRFRSGDSSVYEVTG